jgi:hypothetical protein
MSSNSNVATIDTSTGIATGVSLGSTTITATYGSLTANTMLLVGIGTPRLSLSSSLNPSTYGQPVSIQATLTSGATGPITFQVDNGSLIPPSNAQAQTLHSSDLAAGVHTITASYAGDANFGPASASITQTVSKATPNLNLSSSLNPSTYEQGVRFTATLPWGSTGNVIFQIDNGGSTAVPIVGDTAWFYTSELPAGSHTITATYAGDANWGAATPATLTQTVSVVTSSLGLSSSLNPSTYGQGVRFTATVPWGATGNVTFVVDNGVWIVPVAVTGNTAWLYTSELPSGSHTITATYGGDANWGAATPATISQTVN